MKDPITRILAAALALAVLLTVRWLPQITSILVLTFAGAVLAVLLDTLTRGMRRILPGGRAVAFTAMMAALIIVFASLIMLTAPRIADQGPQLTERVPEAWNQLKSELGTYPVLTPVVDKANHPAQWFADSALWSGVLSNTFYAFFNLLVVLFVAVYLAVDPERYLNLARYLLPTDRRDRARDLTRQLGHELRFWLLGRSLSMALVGLGTGIGLGILGVPLAFTLGLLAGVVSFVPYLGPILGLIPALLIAATQSWVLAGWVLALYAGIQTLESMVLTPLIQQRAVSMPPAVLIIAQLLGGLLAGPGGVLFAAPMVVSTAVIMRWNQRTSDQPAA